MAGLACGEPSLLAWRILRRYADAFVSCSDEAAMKGMRALACPLPGDPPIVSGESGAVTAGLLLFILDSPSYKKIQKDLKLDMESKVLLISTEGDTDPAMYQKITGARQAHW